MKVNLKDTLTTSTRGLIRYDYGQKLEIYNSDLTIQNINAQFIQNGVEIDKLAELVDEHYVVEIPDSFLKNSEQIFVYLYVEDTESGKTQKIIVLEIFDREKYIPVPDKEEEHILAEILDKLNELQYKIDHFELTPEQLQSIVDSVLSELSDNIYTKQETDAAIQTAISNIDLSVYATKTELQELSAHFGQTTSALGSAIGKETSDRTSADSALGLRITNLENTVGQANAILEGVL